MLFGFFLGEPEFFHFVESEVFEVGAGGAGDLFHGLEAGLEFAGGVVEGGFGVDGEVAGVVDGGEEEVSEFVFDFCQGGGGFDFGFDFGEFFGDFGAGAFVVGPVEADFGGFFLGFLGAHEGGEGAGDAVQDTLAFGLFFFFDGVPVADNFVCVGGVDVAEDVGVAADEFFDDAGGGGAEGEFAALGGELGVEDDVEEEVSEFFAEGGGIGGVDGVDDFVAFFDELGAEGSVGLFAIPGAAAGAAQDGHDLDELFDGVEVWIGDGDGHGVDTKTDIEAGKTQ